MRKNTQWLYFLLAPIIVVYGCNAPNKEPATTDSTAVNHSSDQNDPLPSWNEGDTKKGLIDFVTAATKEGGNGFIPVADRIAVIDNDGTLWSEQPMYFQFMFVLDKIKQMAPDHPEWKNKEPFKSVLAGNPKAALAGGEKALLEMVAVTSTGMNSDVYDRSVRAWADTAKHPVSHKKYTEMIFQPMLELLQYLRSNGFQTFIVSGGEISFMRAWAENVYGIPPQQVVGTVMKSEYKVTGDTAVIMRLPALSLMDDGPGKPIGIYEHIGKKPVFAAGNSDGDYQMLQYTSSNSLPHKAIIVHHTDSTREFRYDRGSHIGRLEKGLDDAARYGWILVDMQKDWKKIYPWNQ